MASVTPRRTGNGSVSWRVQFRMGDPAKVKQYTFQVEKAARDFGALVDRVGPEAAIATLNARENRAIGMPTLEEFTAHYLDPASGLLTGVENGTRAGYLSIAKRSFLAVLGPLPIDAVDKPDVGRWVAWQEAQKSARAGADGLIAAKTVKNYHALLSSILQAAVDQKLRPDNPARGTRLTRGRKREAVFLSQREFETLLHFVPEYYQPLVLFMAGTGTRWGEATAATWGDVEIATNPAIVRIDKAWKKGADGTPVLGVPKSERSRRTISLWPELVDRLGEPRAGNEYLFPGMASGKNIRYGGFNTRIWGRAVADANNAEKCAAVGLVPVGKKPRIHDLRHSHASWLIAAGAPLPFVQARLGHEKITTTVDTYGHLLPDAHRQMSQIMSETMSNVLPVLGEIAS
jgi:integrase